MTAGSALRRAVRRSGYAACLGVVLFLVAGLSYLTRADAPPRLWDGSWAPGVGIPFDGLPTMVLWAPDLPGGPDGVTCTLSDAPAFDGPLPAGPDASRAAYATTTVDGRELTYLARVAHVRRGTVTCDGEGLTEVLVSDDVRPGLERGSAVAFFAAAGIAALWALVSLRATRRPDAAR